MCDFRKVFFVEEGEWVGESKISCDSLSKSMFSSWYDVDNWQATTARQVTFCKNADHKYNCKFCADWQLQTWKISTVILDKFNEAKMCNNKNFVHKSLNYIITTYSSW